MDNLPNDPFDPNNSNNPTPAFGSSFNPHTNPIDPNNPYQTQPPTSLISPNSPAPYGAGQKAFYLSRPIIKTSERSQTEKTRHVG